MANLNRIATVTGEVIEFLFTAASGMLGGAYLSQKLTGKGGITAESAEKIGKAFDIHFLGLGTQDELNNWLALCGLMQWEEVPDKLPPGMKASDCAEQLGLWACGLKPNQKKGLVLTMGSLFADVEKTFLQQQPAVTTTSTGTGTPAATPTATVTVGRDPQVAFKVAQKEAAETFCLLLDQPDDETRTKVAIGMRLIPAHDWLFDAGQWLLIQWQRRYSALQAVGKGAKTAQKAIDITLQMPADVTEDIEKWAENLKKKAHNYRQEQKKKSIWRKMFWH